MRAVLMERYAALLREPTRAELAAAAGVDEADVVFDAVPFSPVPTEHVAVVNGRRHFANDFVDALEVIVFLGGIGRAETECPDCGEPLSVEAAIRRVSAPREYVVQRRLLFASEQHLEFEGGTETVDACWQAVRAAARG